MLQNIIHITPHAVRNMHRYTEPNGRKSLNPYDCCISVQSSLLYLKWPSLDCLGYRDVILNCARDGWVGDCLSDLIIFLNLTAAIFLKLLERYGIIMLKIVSFAHKT